MRLNAEGDHGEADLTRSLRLALDAGFIDHAGRAVTNRVWGTARGMRLDGAERRVTAAIDDIIEHDLDHYYRGRLGSGISRLMGWPLPTPC